MKLFAAALAICFILGVAAVAGGFLWIAEGDAALALRVFLVFFPPGLLGLLGLLLLLTPLTVIYAARRARGAHRDMLAKQRSRPGEMLRLSLMPAIVLVSSAMAFIQYDWMGESQKEAMLLLLSRAAPALVGPVDFYTGFAVVDLFVWALLAFGNLCLILFFATIPYLLGHGLALVLLCLQWSGLERDANPGLPGDTAPPIDDKPEERLP